MMIDTRKLDRVIDDCLDEMGEGDARHVVLVANNGTLAVGTNIQDKDFVCSMLVTAIKIVQRQRDQMEECKGSA